MNHAKEEAKLNREHDLKLAALFANSNTAAPAQPQVIQVQVPSSASSSYEYPGQQEQYISQERNISFANL